MRRSTIDSIVSALGPVLFICYGFLWLYMCYVFMTTLGIYGLVPVIAMQMAPMCLCPLFVKGLTACMSWCCLSEDADDVAPRRHTDRPAARSTAAVSDVGGGRRPAVYTVRLPEPDATAAAGAEPPGYGECAQEPPPSYEQATAAGGGHCNKL